jgi:hypothetical protein
MYIQASSYGMNPPQKENEEVKEGAYFIVDWVGNDPIRRGNRKPIIIAGNLTEEELASVKDGRIKLEPPRFGTVQRVLLKVVAVEKL